MESFSRRIWKCHKENCNITKRSFQTFWWHCWTTHKLFLCVHCGREFQTFADYENHLSQYNDSGEAKEKRQSSTETIDPTEQSNTSNPKGPNLEDSSPSVGSFSSGPFNPNLSVIDKYKKIICDFPTCPWTNMKRELNEHIYNVHQPQKEKEKLFKCLLCVHYVLKCYVDIWWHYLKKHRRYACHICCDLFSTIDTYDEHQLAHKNNEIVGKDQRKLEPKQSGTVFCCPYKYCRKRGNEEAIKCHISEMHIKSKKCCICYGHKYKNLWIHYWNKHGVLLCEFCQLPMTTYDFYEEHRQTHTKRNTEPQKATLRHDDISISDVNVKASTSDVNVVASTSQDSPPKCQKPL